MGENIFVFLLAIVSSLVVINSVIAIDPKRAGFTLRMIHIDSKESPLYPGDHLTREERFQRLIQQSKDRLRYIESKILLQSNATNPNVVLPLTFEASRYYVTNIRLGTFKVDGVESSKDYYLIIDSGSDITWLQCEGAEPKFNQNSPLYPYQQSESYKPIPCSTHPNCKEGSACSADGYCTYYESYGSGQTSYGSLALETFFLPGAENMPLPMGCGFEQQNFDQFISKNHEKNKPDLIAGILGLGRGSWSFLNSLGDVGQGRFSYCLEKYDDSLDFGSNTFLRFGADAVMIGSQGQRVYKTPMVVPEFQTSLYYLNLKDISVGNKKAMYPSDTFQVTKYGRGGSIIDSGAPWSSLNEHRFVRIAEMVRDHFAMFHIDPTEDSSPDGVFSCCFLVPQEWNDPAVANYPSITFKFQQADFVVSGIGAAFVQYPDQRVCLGIASMTSGPNTPNFVLGAMQQTNKKILYDLMDLSVSFADQDCLQDLS